MVFRQCKLALCLRYSKICDLGVPIVGEQYIAITPGFYDEDLGTTYLKNGDYITDTGSAVVLEDLISKFLFNSSQDAEKSKASAAETTTDSNTDSTKE